MVIYWEMHLVEDGVEGGEQHQRICKMCIYTLPIWMWL